MTRPRKPPRYTVIPHPDATADVAALAAYGLEVVAAAVTIADDLAHGRVIGKELGERQVSGNLTGFARVKFDVSAQRPQRFRPITASSTTSPWRLSPSARAMSSPPTVGRCAFRLFGEGPLRTPVPCPLLSLVRGPHPRTEYLTI